MNHSKCENTLKIIEYHNIGYDTSKISSLVGISYGGVLAALKRNNLQINTSKNNLTREQRESLAAEYISGKRCLDLEKKYGITRSAILGILYRRNITVRKDTIQMTDQTKSVIELYKSGLSCDQISKKMGIKRANVQVAIHSRGLSGNRSFYRKFHTLNDSYFESIDTEKKAYFLGLLCADGSINSGNKKRNSIFISLKKQDSYLIEEFKKDIGSSVELKERVFKEKKWENQMYFSVSSKKMRDDLIAHGCTPQKSISLKFPKIEDKCLWPFVRGYFDGDGCVSISNRKDCISVIRKVEICVSEDFGVYMRDLLNSFGITSYVRKGKTKIHTISINRQDHIIKFRDFMYRESSIHMKRKRNKFYL